MIRSISLGNFKSYRDATLPLAPLSLLIGANASGKCNAIASARLRAGYGGPAHPRLEDLPDELELREQVLPDPVLSAEGARAVLEQLRARLAGDPSLAVGLVARVGGGPRATAPRASPQSRNRRMRSP